MIVVKRLAALGVAMALIAGALFARDQWIDGDDSNDGGTSRASVLVCATELAAMCNQIAAGDFDISVRVADVGGSLTQLADDEMWFTFTPFPEIVTQTRERTRQSELVYTTEPVASSHLAIVALVDRAVALQAACGQAIDWRCLGDLAGDDWEGAGGDATWGRIRPAFAPTTSGYGRLGFAAAAAGYFGDLPVDTSDAFFSRWAQGMLTEVNSSSLSAGTAVATLQTGRAALDVAIGSATELVSAQADRFTVLTPDPPTRIDLVLAVPAGAAAPSGLAAALRTAAHAAGWLAAGAPGVTGEPADANTVIATTQAWEALT